MSISVKEIDALLPQTQCGECGFSGCKPYAEALSAGQAPINRCPPGGTETIYALANLLKIDAVPYLKEDNKFRQPAVAIIREAECIGCTKCIQACPVDAIIGSSKFLHTVISTECTGCGLCIEPCPVDCIDLLPEPLHAYNRNLARERFEARNIRQAREQQEKQQKLQERQARMTSTTSQQAKQHYILQALARVNAKKNE